MCNFDVREARIVVLSGGFSDEREIALQSGRACHRALEAAGFKQVDFIEIKDTSFIQQLLEGNYDCAFVAMHGRYGEDGCIQGLLEMIDLPYTFSGVLSSALSAEKETAKLVYEKAGIPVPQGVELTSAASVDPALEDQLISQLGLPLFVKPACNGSSYGVTKVTEKGQLKDAVAKALENDEKALVETCIEGVEITVPVIGNEDPHALPIVEISYQADFYDLTVKYEPSELHHVIPARLDPESYAQAQTYAVQAHKALGCSGVSRSDFIVQADGTPVILETNSIPGMTETSLLPDSAAHEGISFPELCTTFVQLAFKRFGVEKLRG